MAVEIIPIYLFPEAKGQRGGKLAVTFMERKLSMLEAQNDHEVPE